MTFEGISSPLILYSVCLLFKKVSFSVSKTHLNKSFFAHLLFLILGLESTQHNNNEFPFFLFLYFSLYLFLCLPLRRCYFRYPSPKNLIFLLTFPMYMYLYVYVVLAQVYKEKLVSLESLNSFVRGSIGIRVISKADGTTLSST